MAYDLPLIALSDAEKVRAEIANALAKFPTWPTDALLQCAYEPKKTSQGEIRAEAIQVVTVAIRFLASFWRYEYTQCGQHRQVEKP